MPASHCPPDFPPASCRTSARRASRPGGSGWLRPPGRGRGWGVCVVLVVWLTGTPALLPSAGGLPRAVAADEALDDFNVAVKLYQKQRWKEAATAFADFLRKNPKHSRAEPARLYLGLAYVEDRKLPEARATLRTFLRGSPNSRNAADVRYRIAECSYLLDDFGAADAEFAVFLKSHPEHRLLEWALPYAADTKLRLGKAADAVALFEQALKQFPEGQAAEEAQFGLARAWEQTGEGEKAIALYRQLAAKKDSVRAPRAQLNLAARYFDAKKYAEAAAAWQELVTRFPDSDLVPTARMNAGYALYEDQKYEQALALFEVAAQSAELKPAASYWRGISLRGLGRLDEAAAVLTESLPLTEGTDLAEENMYQLADTRMRQGKFAEAGKLYQTVLQKWPEGQHAAESLHFAAEAAFRGGDADAATRLTERYERDIQDPKLAAWHHLLRGRLLASRGGPQDTAASVKLFRQSIVEAAKIPDADAEARARIFLTRALQRLDQHPAALEAITPLTTQLLKVQQPGPYNGALVLAGVSRMAAGELQPAVDLFGSYLEREPRGSMVDQALSQRAVATARLGRFEAAAGDLKTLLEQHAASPTASQTVLSLAEMAWEAERWKLAGEWFGLLIDRKGAEPLQAAALSGQAWSLYQQKDYATAAAQFAAIEKKYPQDAVRAAEAAFMQGRALQDAGDHARAAAQYSAAFEKYAPEKPAAAGREQDVPLRHTYLAGLQAARVRQQLGQVAEAHDAYSALLKTFPQPVHLDRLLDEWALMNLEAERYDESDAVFRRLLRERPESVLADNARLSLAESDYVAGRLAEATKTFEQLQISESSDAQVRQRALYQLVKIAFEQKDWKQVAARSADLLKRFPESSYRREISFHQAEAMLNQGELDEATRLLARLAASPAESQSPDAEWFPQVLMLLAEAQLRQKKYGLVEETIGRLQKQFPGWPLLYKADEILGRALKNQARFDGAREALLRVVNSENGRRTPTAAKSQFLVAETWLIQKKYAEAHREYFRVYTLYDYPEWQAPALFQAARCDEARNRWKEAARLYQDLLREFPQSEYTEQAKRNLLNARRKAEAR